MKDDKFKELIVPKGFSPSQDSLICPHCKKKEVYHAVHWRVICGQTLGFICKNCQRTWK